MKKEKVKKEKVKKEKVKKSVCIVCKKNIDTEKDKYTALSTTEKGKVIDQSNFHFECFKQWHNSKVEEKARLIVIDMQNKAIGLLGHIKSVAGVFGGLDKLQGMLETDLKEDKKKEK